MCPQGPKSPFLCIPIVGPKGPTPGGVLVESRGNDDLGGEAAIAAAEIEERLAVEDFDALYFAKEDGVIAGDIGCDDVAPQVDERLFQKRDAGFGPAVADAKFRLDRWFLFPLCEIDGDGLLIVLENVHTEAFFLHDHR